MSLIKRLHAELEEIIKDPPLNCEAVPLNDDNLQEWIGMIVGPENTPYHNGLFKLSITFPDNYPFEPPKIFFLTKIFHCNVSSGGGICLDILKEEWSPALTISKVLLSISSLLSDCNPDDPLVSSIAQLYKSDRDLHDRRARAWTALYAK